MELFFRCTLNLRFLYTGQQIVYSPQKIDLFVNLLILSDRCCIDDVRDHCVHCLSDPQNFSVELFYKVFPLTKMETTVFSKHLKTSLSNSILFSRQNFLDVVLCVQNSKVENFDSFTLEKICDGGNLWSTLPLDFVVEILSNDRLPVDSETEVGKFRFCTFLMSELGERSYVNYLQKYLYYWTRLG